MPSASRSRVGLALTAFALLYAWGCDGDAPTGLDLARIDVTTSTIGDDDVLDPNGYVVVLDGGESKNIGVAETVSFFNVPPGDHSVELTDVAGNCAVTGENPRTLTIVDDETVVTTFIVTCNGFL